MRVSEKEVIVEAFVLISNGSVGDTDGIVSQGRSVGTWTGQAIGEFDAIVKVEAPTLSGLRAQVRALRKGNEGPVRTESLVVVRKRPSPVKRTSEPPGTDVALCLIELRPGKLDEAIAKLNEWEAGEIIHAWVVVTGSADLIVEIWGANDEALQASIDELQALPGLRRQRTTYVETV